MLIKDLVIASKGVVDSILESEDNIVKRAMEFSEELNKLVPISGTLTKIVGVNGAALSDEDKEILADIILNYGCVKPQWARIIRGLSSNGAPVSRPAKPKFPDYKNDDDMQTFTEGFLKTCNVFNIPESEKMGHFMSCFSELSIRDDLMNIMNEYPGRKLDEISAIYSAEKGINEFSTLFEFFSIKQFKRETAVKFSKRFLKVMRRVQRVWPVNDELVKVMFFCKLLDFKKLKLVIQF